MLILLNINWFYVLIFTTVVSFCIFFIKIYKFLNKKALFVIISGPPAIGKNTVYQYLIDNLKHKNIDVNFIKSYTTRKKRNKSDGDSYHFISKYEFNCKIKNNHMLEYVINPNNGEYYGFAISDIKRNIFLKRISIVLPTYNFLLELKKYIKNNNIKNCEIISIYLLPASIDDIKERIKIRNTENKEEMERRINSVENDIKTSSFYDIKITNYTSYETAILLNDQIIQKLHDIGNL